MTRGYQKGEILSGPAAIALSLYRSVVLPHYNYCATIHMCANKGTLHKLQLVQNVGCRTVLLDGKKTQSGTCTGNWAYYR